MPPGCSGEPASATPTTAGPAIPLVGDELLRLGGEVEIDARLSWRHPGDHGWFEPVNVYLLREGPEALLVEAGVALHGPTIHAQLAPALPDGAPLRLALTRNEPDCMSNLPNLAGRWNFQAVYSPGLMNPLDYFEDASTRLQMLSFGVEQTPIRPGDRIPIGATRTLEAVLAPIRMLSTTWYYQAETRTLFCSDMFTDGRAQRPGDCVIGEPVGLSGLVEAMRAHLALRYDWLARSHLSPIVVALEDLFALYDVDVLAPSRGCVIQGRAAVRERIEALLATLRAVGRSA